MTLRGPTVVADFQKIVIDYIEEQLARGRRQADAGEELLADQGSGRAYVARRGDAA